MKVGIFMFTYAGDERIARKSLDILAKVLEAQPQSNSYRVFIMDDQPRALGSLILCKENPFPIVALKTALPIRQSSPFNESFSMGLAERKAYAESKASLPIE